MRPTAPSEVRLSVVVTTYNNPRGLELVLAGLERQSRQSFELLIADDGSGGETAALIAGFAQRVSFPVRHVWHPDEGFRKCTICNKAIQEATGNYLVFFDGDCIPGRHCLELHVRSARRDSYLAGGAVYLNRDLSDRLTPSDVSAGLLDRPGLWWMNVNKKRRLLVRHIPLIRDVMNARVPREPSWRGGNSSAWADHMRAVGGFDERFTYGFEDADFGHRLQALGVHGRSIRYSNPVMHVEHSRPYADPLQLAHNRKLYEENRAIRLVRTPYGIPVS
ncbi:MAG TPA: glycosyltransferase [Gemmatimonadales bacterium]|nr:glycosyltransferase [Gemmatimonadales bacterium]